ncbi:MAG: nitroreductase family protein [Bacteroidales bacterium]|nr:nitroreductase family protein [Bacteroidales bacterium]
MANNYMEKRYEATLGAGRTKVKRVGHTLDELLLKNRSHRAYLKDYVVSRAELERIVAVGSRIPSACNQQVLRYRLVTRGPESDIILGNIRLGAALPELHLPCPGTEPEAFIVVCSTAPETKLVDIDLGIAIQSMLLKAVEMGLNGIAIGAFNRENVKRDLDLPLDPLMILAIGKGSDRIQLVPIHESDPHAYYRDGGTHYVPKIPATELIV